MATPTKPGFYWAKWRSADPGTADNSEGCPGDNADWEVVEVWENSLDPSDDEYLMVYVGGVGEGQGLHRFEWHSAIPLDPPENWYSSASLTHSSLNSSSSLISAEVYAQHCTLVPKVIAITVLSGALAACATEAGFKRNNVIDAVNSAFDDIEE